MNLNKIYKSKSNESDNIGKFETKELNKMITRIAGLIFGTEAQRNPAAMVHSHMILDLIENGNINFKEAFHGYSSMPQPERKIIKQNDNGFYFIQENQTWFYFPVSGGIIYTWTQHPPVPTSMEIEVQTIETEGREIYILKDFNTKQIVARATAKIEDKEAPFVYGPLMPMAPSSATSMDVSLNKKYKERMPYPYVHNGDDNAKYEILIAAEDNLVKLWALKIAGLQLGYETDQVIEKLEKACKEKWFNIDISMRKRSSAVEQGVFK